MPKLASHNACTGCLACMDSCNHKAISIQLDHELQYPVVNSEKCVECKVCEKACPVVTPIRLNQVEDIRVAAGWAADETLRINAASGGAFAGIAVSFIKRYDNNVAVYGACLKENRVYHERISSISELPLLMNSKYIQSDTRGVYLKVHENLKANRYVLFSGTPCQIAGLYGYLGRKRDDEHLLTIELICAGVMSPEALDIHLESNNSPKIISFRSKINGASYGSSQRTTIEKDGKPYRFEKRYDDVFYRCFSSSILERKSCFNCRFARLERVADITIGDYWGGEKDIPEYDKGVNVILANNSKGKSFIVDGDSLVFVKSSLRKAVDGNPCLYNGVNLIKFHPLVLWANPCKNILPRKIWLSIVKNDTPWKYFWAIFRLLSIGFEKMQYKRVRSKYSKIL